MKKDNLKFLKFRTELIELLDKYKYEISGTGNDDGSIQINNSRYGVLYTISDSRWGYKIYDEDFIEEYILHFFKEKTICKK